MNGPKQIFDRPAYARRRARGDSGFLVVEAAERLSERLQAVNRTFESALDLSSRDAAFLRYQAAAKHWTRTALHKREGTLQADEEQLPFPSASFDLVVSTLALHAVNDLPGALIQIRRALKPDGFFIAALFGGETLTELRQAIGTAEAELLNGVSPRVSPFADVRDLGGLLQRAGLALPVADIERIPVRYGDIATLFSDLRTMGETNSLAGRDNRFLSRRFLARVAEAYGADFSDPDGKHRATFDIVFLAGWAPHESQQKPLKPGSAKTRLADALGTRETPSGEKP